MPSLGRWSLPAIHPDHARQLEELNSERLHTRAQNLDLWERQMREFDQMRAQMNAARSHWESQLARWNDLSNDPTRAVVDGLRQAAGMAPYPGTQQEEEKKMPETLLKRSREMVLRYPFAIEHGGRSYRMSYHADRRRWRIQEWDNKRCVKIHEQMVRGQTAAHTLRQQWMEARTAQLALTR